jgi:hypothetical protein
MYDLIYGGQEYQEELQTLFPTAKITDASDDIHGGRLVLEVEIEEEEYDRIIFLNGFAEFSLRISMWMIEKKEDVILKLKEWREKFPEFFESTNEK